MNPRLSVPQTDALPAELLPPLVRSLARPSRRRKLADCTIGDEVEGYQLSDSSNQEAVPPDVSSRSLVAGHSPSRRAERNSGSVSGLDSLKADLERRGATGTLRIG